MIETFKKLLSLLGRSGRRRLCILLLVNTVSSALQVLSVASFVPFVALLAQPSLVEENKYFILVSQYFEIQNANQFLLASGLFVLILIVFTNISLAVNTRTIQKFAHMVGLRIAGNLFKVYMSQPYVYFLDKNGSELAKNILMEAMRVVKGILIPALVGIAKSMTVLLLVILLIVVDPFIALTAMLFFGCVYSLIFLAIRKKLTANGKILSQKNKERYGIAAEALGGIRDIKILGRENFFLKRFEHSSRGVVDVEVYAGTASEIPRYAVESLVFGGMLLMVIITVYRGHDISTILPLISLYALAGYRLVPALQEAFARFANIRYAAPALDLVHADLAKAVNTELVCTEPTTEKLPYRDAISLSGVSYRYKSANKDAISDISIKIPANTTVGLVGESGSGKSSLVNILLGLLSPTQGAVYVDDQALDEQNMRKWQNVIGYVPQAIFISDSTIKENIAFGLPPEEIDMDRVRRVAKLASIDTFIERELPGGYDCSVGERGSRLSGGQCQRIGIARALYNDPKVLILDEATSALDSITEQEIMSAIYALAKEITVIMIAHRLSTVKNCDQIIMLGGGRILASGSYHDLMHQSDDFARLVNAQESPISG